VWRNSRTAELARERRQAKWVAWGVGVGMMPFVPLRAAARVRRAAHRSLDIVRLCALAVPLAFAIAVIRHQFMDIDVIIRRSLIYALLAAMLTAIYLALGSSSASASACRAGPSAETQKLLAAGLAALLFFPTQKAIGGWVDHTFFRIRPSHERAAREFRTAIAGWRIPEGGRRARRVPARRARAHAAVVRLRRIARHGSRRRLRAARAAERSARSRAWNRSRRPQPHGLPELERHDYPPPADRTGSSSRGRSRRRSGRWARSRSARRKTERRFIEQDFALLEAVALEASPRSSASSSCATPPRRNRTAPAGRARPRKSEFLSQVAHDLGTPLTSILWSSQNLIDGIGDVGEIGALDPRGRLAPVAAVGEPPAIAHLDDGALTLRPEPSRSRRSWSEVWPRARAARAVARGDAVDGALRRRLAARGRRPRGPHEGRDQRDRQRDQARAARLDAFAPLERVAGRQGFAVVDHGPGVPDATRRGSSSATCAARTRTARGFGLGTLRRALAARGLAGPIEVTDTPGGGATFTCTLLEEGSWPRILIVDDDASLAGRLATACGTGSTRSTTPRTEDGARGARQRGYDVVLLDLQLPDGSGNRLLAETPASRRDHADRRTARSSPRSRPSARARPTSCEARRLRAPQEGARAHPRPQEARPRESRLAERAEERATRSSPRARRCRRCFALAAQAARSNAAI
jgi:hypothetical protein